MLIPEYKKSHKLMQYPEALQFMENRVDKIIKQQEKELIWFLEHPAIYTAGTSANKEDLLNAQFPIFYTGRGGGFTYHGPGQLIIYILINLKKLQAQDIKLYVYNLEQIIINTLNELSISGHRISDSTGIWVKQHNNEYKKIAAIGIRIRKWVTYHGIALNIDPNLTHYNGIIPCGIKERGITSLRQEGIRTKKSIIISKIQQYIEEILITNSSNT